MHEYLIFTLQGPEKLRTNERYGHNQKKLIDGIEYTSHHYHYFGNGPYGILISPSNPVRQEQIQEAIERTELTPLPW